MSHEKHDNLIIEMEAICFKEYLLIKDRSKIMAEKFFWTF